ncbi:unnamed protein product, partial [Tenebrio molitor]
MVNGMNSGFRRTSHMTTLQGRRSKYTPELTSTSAKHRVTKATARA